LFAGNSMACARANEEDDDFIIEEKSEPGTTEILSPGAHSAGAQPMRP